VTEVVKCPFCNFEGGFDVLKTWKFRSYDVEMSKCPKCNGIFNYYKGATTRFVIRIKPRARGAKEMKSLTSSLACG
jgi:Zn-finger nucleic acid-binding protein